jgi:hypothetical protein
MEDKKRHSHYSLSHFATNHEFLFLHSKTSFYPPIYLSLQPRNKFIWIPKIVYSRNVVDFATVQKNSAPSSRVAINLILRHLLLPATKYLLLYYQSTLLPKTEPVYDVGNELFVSELDYRRVESKIELYVVQHKRFFWRFSISEPTHMMVSYRHLCGYLADIIRLIT